MKFGLFYIMNCPEGMSQAQLYRETIEQIEYAEEAGFDSIWFAEHHFSNYCIAPSPHLLVSHVAARTKRIRVGIAVTVLPFHHPVRIAEEAAMLDVLTQGRLNFGIGRGVQVHEFAKWGVTMADSRERFLEEVDILLRAWGGEEFSYEGRYYKIPPLQVYPQPLQKPHPPIFVAGLNPETIGWCGSKGYPFLSLLSIGQIKGVLPRYREALTQAGLNPTAGGVIPVRHAYLAGSDAEARRDVEKHYKQFWQFLLQAAVPVGGTVLPESYKFYNDFYERVANLDYDIAVKGHLGFFGGPETVRESIKLHQQELGCDTIICLMQFAQLKHEQILRSMKLLAHEVMPYFP
jgi:alkanesulfonate monooxygenase SsuD/methylene tetrahydromethanopterin reductase-like flavin-dependent oxidoreductase (luciferase family)